MDFFEHQDQARRNTKQLIGLFGLAIIAMIVSLYAITLMGLVSFFEQPLQLWQPDVLLVVSVGTLAMIGAGSVTKMVELRRGGPAVAESLGGTQVNPQTTDFKEKQLLNVVAEMALASGTPIPTVYLLHHELGINAFAAGYAPDDAVIGVTRGCLEQLSRDELQGVIAHEFSHILNGDMRLNLKLMGVLQGLLYIYIIGRILTRSSSSHSQRRDRDGRLFCFGLAIMLVGSIGLTFGRLIKSCVSRQREFLADASAVQFTRNPLGLAGALRRIGGHGKGSRLQSPKAESASHMFFGAVFQPTFLQGWMATHPPLSERIRRMTGQLVTPASVPTAPLAFPNELANAGAMGLAAEGTASAGLTPAESASTGATAAIPPVEQFMASVGTASPQHLAKAHAWLQSLPPELSEAIDSPTGAMTLVFSLLLDARPAVRSRQLALVQASPLAIEPAQVVQIADLLSGLDARRYLPLLDLSIPALRTITPQQCADFFKQIQALVKADGKLSLSEYVLQLIVQKRLRPHFQKRLEQPKAVTNLAPLWEDCQVVLTLLAKIGHTNTDDAFYAFKSALSSLPGASKRPLPQALPTFTLAHLGPSLKRLQPAVPKLKQAIVDAAAHAVLVDQSVTIREAELLRAIVITLDCPIPPFLDTASSSPQAKSAKATVPNR
ncbi:MAG: M48 family metallopeptidase [Cyanobacteria bacterium J06607_6]